jgi:hypothetical protein
MSSDSRTSAPPDQHAAVRDYGLVCMGALTLLVAGLVLRRPDPWVLLPALLGALGLLFRWRAGPVIVLLAVLLVLGSWWVGTSPGRMLTYALAFVVWLAGRLRGRLPVWRPGPESRDVIPVSDFLVTVSVLAYTAGQYRLQGLTRRLFPVVRLRRAPEAAKKEEEVARRSPELVTGREVGGMLAGGAACGVGAALFWDWLQGQETELVILDTAWQGILVLWLVGGAVLLIAAGLRYLALRRMTRAEAQLFLQDVLWRETRGEQRRLNRWLAWAWLRRRRREEREQS